MVAERSVAPIKAAKGGYILLAIAACVIGVRLIASPDVNLLTLERALGVYMMLFGAVKLLGYCSKDLFRLAFQHDLACGILLMALGLITLATPENTLSFLCVMMGIPLLMDGLLKLQIALDARAFGIGSWYLIFALALLTSVFGALMMLRLSQNPLAIVRLTGMSMLSEGVLSLAVALLTVKIIRHQKPDSLL